MSSVTIANGPRQSTTVEQWFHYKQKRLIFWITGLISLLLLASIISLSFGPAGWDIRLSVAWISPGLFPDISALQFNVVTDIRMPRLILAILVGAILAQTGAATQALCRNPLADPSVIGVSSGAAVVAVAMIAFAPLLPFQVEVWLPYGAFAGALVVTLLVYGFARSDSGIQVLSLILVGVAINALAFALIGLFSFYADDSSLRLINYWTMGSLAGATWSSLLKATPLLVISLVGLYLKRHQISLLLLGESEARYLGVNIDSLKNQVVLLVAIGVGAAVSLTGLVGFVGLVIPHLARLLVGSNMKMMFPLSFLMGALVLLMSDWIARIVVSPAELPIGIVTALVGAPLFIWMLRRQLTPQK